MNERSYDIGDFCTFRDFDGTTRRGRIVSCLRTWCAATYAGGLTVRFTVRIAGALFEDCEVPESALVDDAVA